MLGTVALATCLALAPPKAKDGALGPFWPEDAANLRSLFAEGDASAAGRITDRLDAVIERVLSGNAGAAPDDESKPKSRSRKSRLATDAPSKDLESELGSAATAWRLAMLGRGLERSKAATLWAGLEDAPAFAQALATSYVPEADKAGNVCDLAIGVMGRKPEQAAKHPELAAAICLVFDDPKLGFRVNEHSVHPPGADLVWRYYTTNAKAMRFGVDIAPELLAFVVDVPASADEIAWAFKNYLKIPRVGALYPKVPYDYDVLAGKPKKSNAAGWNLPNILQYGGICADQAYFTVTVAKAIGVPAVYTVGDNNSSGHAWAGFVHTDGKHPYWDTEGRYDSYRGVLGQITDPQTGRRVPDAVMPMLVEWGLEPRQDRLRSAVLRIVDDRLEDRSKEKDADAASLAAARERVLRDALRACPTDVRAWFAVRDLGASRGLDRAGMQAWFADICTLCGAHYPEMVFEVASPMIAGVASGEEQHALWLSLADYLAGSPANRGDLAARALVRDGAMWEAAKEPEKAGQAYEAVIRNFPDTGPPVRTALTRAAAILASQRDDERLLALYATAFGRMTPPKDMPGIFGRESTWFQVGKAYVDLLQRAGRGGDAAALDQRLERHLANAAP